MFGAAGTDDRPGDLDYFLERKDYKSVYESLRSSASTRDKFIVDDAEANGLVPSPNEASRMTTC